MGLLLVFSILSPAFAQKADRTLDQLDFTEIGTDSVAVGTNDKAQLNAANVSVGKTEIDAVKTGPKSGQTEQEKTLSQTFIAGLLGGFIAFLMPCIFPMVPLTVSYFTKRAGSKQKGIGQAMIYGLAIIAAIQRMGTDINKAFKILARHIDLLTDMKHVYTASDLLGKREFVKLVFDSNLYYFEGIYRTPTMLQMFDHNALKMKEKGLLIYEKKRGILSDSPLGGAEGSRTLVQL